MKIILQQVRKLPSLANLIIFQSDQIQFIGYIKYKKVLIHSFRFRFLSFYYWYNKILSIEISISTKGRNRKQNEANEGKKEKKMQWQ